MFAVCAMSEVVQFGEAGPPNDMGERGNGGVIGSEPHILLLYGVSLLLSFKAPKEGFSSFGERQRG